MIPRFLLPFLIIFGHLGLVPCESAADKGDNIDAPAPVVTQKEILVALGLEISKIRVVHIPKGEQVTLELIEITEPHGSRRLAHVSLAPDSDWIELLISAQTGADGCRKFNVKLSHENPVFTDWSIDIEKRFGAGKRALPIAHSGGLLNFDSNVFPYRGQAFEIAGFRLTSSKPNRRYKLELKAYSEPVGTKNK